MTIHGNQSWRAVGDSVDIQHAGIVSRAAICVDLCETNLFVRCIHSADVQHAVIVSRAVIFASSGEVSLLFRWQVYGNCRSEGHVVRQALRGMKHR